MYPIRSHLPDLQIASKLCKIIYIIDIIVYRFVYARMQHTVSSKRSDELFSEVVTVTTYFLLNVTVTELLLRQREVEKESKSQ